MDGRSAAVLSEPGHINWFCGITQVRIDFDAGKTNAERMGLVECWIDVQVEGEARDAVAKGKPGANGRHDQKEQQNKPGPDQNAEQNAL